MAKVYVVTEGEYSSYHIVGAFSTREKAAEFCPAAAKEVGSACIEEIELDTLENEEYLQEVFSVYIDIKTGSVKRFSGQSEDVTSEPKQCRKNFFQVTGGENGLADHYGDFIWAESSISAEHAMKLAIEHRQRMLREQTIKS